MHKQKQVTKDRLSEGNIADVVDSHTKVALRKRQVLTANRFINTTEVTDCDMVL